MVLPCMIWSVGYYNLGIYMPLTKKGLKIREALQKYYGKDKGESVMYALINKGKVTGAERKPKKQQQTE